MREQPYVVSTLRMRMRGGWQRCQGCELNASPIRIQASARGCKQVLLQPIRSATSQEALSKKRTRHVLHSASPQTPSRCFRFSGIPTCVRFQ